MGRLKKTSNNCILLIFECGKIDWTPNLNIFEEYKMIKSHEIFLKPFIYKNSSHF